MSWGAALRRRAARPLPPPLVPRLLLRGTAGVAAGGSLRQ